MLVLLNKCNQSKTLPSKNHLQKKETKWEHEQQMGLESQEWKIQDVSKLRKSLLTELYVVLMTFTTSWLQFETHIKALQRPEGLE